MNQTKQPKIFLSCRIKIKPTLAQYSGQPEPNRHRQIETLLPLGTQGFCLAMSWGVLVAQNTSLGGFYYYPQ